MTNPDKLKRENEALRDRISKLSSASLRICASLDLGTVLREAVEGACALTSARYGLIATIDDSGKVQDFVTAGFTPEEDRRLADWPDGLQLFEHFRDLPGPLRLRDLPGYIQSLGFSTELVLWKIFQGTPMHHRGVHLGNFFLAEKEGGGEFTSEDEQVLVLFASQAAAAIANARTHRAEQRARADLEALVETSPVGVVVFGARTGHPLRFNREARRIVEGLRQPGHSPEQLLEAITYRRADGREIALDEFPLALELSAATTVRAEEIVLEVPDGRSVKTLVNATPIRSADGEVESLVVTMQDLAPLEELERSRAEFLSLVSHELRAPLTSVKGSAATVLGASPPLEPAEMLQFFHIIDQQADHMRGLISDLLDAGRIETGTLSVTPEPVEVAGLVDQARNTFLSGGGRHTVLIDLPPDLPRVLADRRRIVQVLNNLFSNASRHAPESSPIRVAAVRDGVHVAISVSDEGRGVPPDLLPYLFRKHARIGARDQERGIGGSGLGLAICKGLAEAHGGRIRAESGGKGRGTRFTFTIPVAEQPGNVVAADLARSSVRSPRKGRERRRILVVDDDPQTLRYVRDALTTAGLYPAGDRRPKGGVPPGQDEKAPPGFAGPDAAWNRRYRVDGAPPRAGRPAGHLHLGLRQGRDDRQSPGEGGRRLYRQALLADRAGGESPGGPAQTCRAAGTLSAGGSGHPLRATPGDGGRASGGADGHRIRTAPRAVGQRGTGNDLRFAAAPGVERERHWRLPVGASLREEAPAQARRRRGQPLLRL